MLVPFGKNRRITCPLSIVKAAAPDANVTDLSLAVLEFSLLYTS